MIYQKKTRRFIKNSDLSLVEILISNLHVVGIKSLCNDVSIKSVQCCQIFVRAVPYVAGIKCFNLFKVRSFCRKYIKFYAISEKGFASFC